MKKSQPRQQMVLAKLDVHMERNKTRCAPLTLGKQDQWDEPEILKLLQASTRKTLKDTAKILSRANRHVSKSWQMGLMELKGFCTSETTAYGGRKLSASYTFVRSI